VKPGTQCRSRPGDIAGILGNLGFNENDVEQALRLF
jgi:hypothetical protein